MGIGGYEKWQNENDGSDVQSNPRKSAPQDNLCDEDFPERCVACNSLNVKTENIIDICCKCGDDDNPCDEYIVCQEPGCGKKCCMDCYEDYFDNIIFVDEQTNKFKRRLASLVTRMKRQSQQL